MNWFLVVLSYTLCSAYVLVVALDSNSADVSTRIINGSPAGKAQFPYQAYINVTNDQGNVTCSGAILVGGWVVTAAHCVVGAESATIIVGSVKPSDKNLSRIVLGASKFVLHDDFDDISPENNIALIKLDRPLTFSTSVQAIRIARTNVVDGTTVVVSGWGTVIDNYNIYNPTLHFASLQTINNRVCAETYNTTVIRTDIMCTISNTSSAKGICLGDFGAPLVVNASTNPLLVGIGNFYSKKACKSLDPSGFTRIPNFANWISSITGN